MNSEELSIKIAEIEKKIDEITQRNNARLAPLLNKKERIEKDLNEAFENEYGFSAGSTFYGSMDLVHFIVGSSYMTIEFVAREYGSFTVTHIDGQRKVAWIKSSSGSWQIGNIPLEMIQRCKRK